MYFLIIVPPWNAWLLRLVYLSLTRTYLNINPTTYLSLPHIHNFFMSYERLSGQMPSNPPEYDLNAEAPSLPLRNRDSGYASGSSSHPPPIEQFEIDDDEVFEPLKRDNVFQRFVFVSKRCAFTFRDKVMEPIVRCLNPICEGYNYFSRQYELSLVKLGNPLVVKRLFYVLFVVAMVFVVSENENTEGINGTSGGAFSAGHFYDMDKLGDTLAHYIEGRTLQENLEYLSSMPHMAGTMGDLALARYVENYFLNNGINNVDFHELETYLNFPTGDSYVKLSDGSFQASITVKDGNAKSEQFLAFNYNSPNTQSEIEAPFIYSNHGDPEDLQKIVDAGIELKDTILLVKYGGITPEANKVYAATQLGVKAVVFISPKTNLGKSPEEGNIKKTNVGLWRYGAGDVLRPGSSKHGSHASSGDWSLSKATPKIPSIPISWKDGMTFVSKLKDRGVDFGDGFYSGSTDRNPGIKLLVKNTERLSHPIWNVVGHIPGREQPEKGVLFGAARDSSCYGAMTSASGTAALLELVKIFSGLQRKYNWSPARSLYFVSFDGTENNLAGCAKWVEARKDSLISEGYTYIDVNGLVTGDKLSVKAHPLIQDVIKDAMKKVPLTDDQKSESVNSIYDLYKAQNDGKDDIDYEMLEERNYIPFINEINMPAVELGFKGEDFVEGTCVDTFQFFTEEKIDPEVKKHKQIVEVLARIGLELVENPMLPFNFETLARSLHDDISDAERFIEDVRKALNLPDSARLSFDGLRQAAEKLKRDAHQLNMKKLDWKNFIDVSSMEPPVFAATRRLMNLNMVLFDSYFLSSDMSRSRVGYANYLYGAAFEAPSSKGSLGYRWNTFPMVRDAVTQGRFKDAQFEIDRLASMILSACVAINPMG